MTGQLPFSTAIPPGLNGLLRPTRLVRFRSSLISPEASQDTHRTERNLDMSARLGNDTVMRPEHHLVSIREGDERIGADDLTLIINEQIEIRIHEIRPIA